MNTTSVGRVPPLCQCDLERAKLQPVTQRTTSAAVAARPQIHLRRREASDALSIVSDEPHFRDRVESGSRKADPKAEEHYADPRLPDFVR